MEVDLQNVADYALNQPGVTGYICIDRNGLCLAAKGDAHPSMSGIIHQIASLASKMENPSSSKPPVIRVELEHYKLTIHTRDQITTALMSPQK